MNRSALGPASSAARIEARDVSFNVGATRILTQINLVVAPGERLALIGPNGSGKSTLLRCLYGWLKPSEGVVLLDGTDVSTLAPRERAKTVAAMMQDAVSGLGLTVEDVVALGRIPHASLWGGESALDREIVEHALVRLSIESLRHREFQSLSGGERQRVSAARCLAQRPSLLILDEPTNHLDIRHQLELLELVGNLGVTVIAALHDLTVAGWWADRVCLLEDGRTYGIGSPDEILRPSIIEAVYGVSAVADQHPLTGRLRLTFGLRAPVR